ncbi:MAG: cadherin-like domain-containing protein [Candidatus Bipolaricaulaceae bacterium]
MRGKLIGCGLALLALFLPGQAASDTLFRVVGGEVALGQAAQLVVVVDQAPAGVRAMEGVLTLTGPGALGEVSSPYQIQLLEQTDRSVRFRWLDLQDELGPGAAGQKLLAVQAMAEAAGELAVELSVPFLATDTGEAAAVRVEGEPLVIRPPAAPNRPPTVHGDLVETQAGAPVTVDVLANDADPDGRLDRASVKVVVPPAHGAVEVGPAGGLIYTPAADFTGTDEFAYTVADDQGAASDPATVRVQVLARPAEEGTPGGPSLQVVGGQWEFGQTGLVQLELVAGAGGLQRLAFALAVADPQVATVTGMEWKGLAAGQWELARQESGWQVRVADLFDVVGPQGRLVAQLQLDFRALGRTQLRVDGVQGVDDQEDTFALPGLSVEVGCVLGPLEPGLNRPRDLDGDGRLEDLDGDGELTLCDALLLAFHYDRSPLAEAAGAVDFDADGSLTFADAQALAKLVGR